MSGEQVDVTVDDTTASVASAAATEEKVSEKEGQGADQGSKQEGSEGADKGGSGEPAKVSGDDPATDEAKAAEKASEAGKELNRRKQSAGERIGELTRKLRESERREAVAIRQRDEAWSKLKEPNPAEFEDPAELTAAKVDHTLDRREVERLNTQAKDAREEAQAHRLEIFRERAVDARAKHPDFDDVVMKPEKLPISRSTQEIILDMDESAEVMYHILKEPAEARRIDGLSERAKAIELGKVAARLSEPVQKRITKAPEPVQSVGGKSSGGASFDPSKATMEEYVKRRNAGWGS
jgi:hypothetical protein